MTDTWHDAITNYLTHQRAAGRPATTLRLRRQQLLQLAAGVRARPWTLTGPALVTYAGGQEWSTETRRSFRSTVRSFYSWGVDTGRVTSPTVAAALAPVRATPPAPHPTSDAALIQALTAADPRERLAIRLAAELGMRRGEVVLVHLRDLERDPAGWSLRVHGKGGRERILPLPDGLAATLREACAEGYAFPGSVDGHLAPATIGDLVGGLLPGRFTMHSLRHRFATQLYRSTGDLLMVQRMLGHTSPVTTQRYVAADQERARAAVVALAAAA